MSESAIPPWPHDVPTHPLVIIDYQLLKTQDPIEIERLWNAATELGFWYLKNHEADGFVDKMFDLAIEVMSLPLEEKIRYEQGNEGMSFGYKMAGASLVSSSGELDTTEELNIAKDDAFTWPHLVRRAHGFSYPPPVLARMESTVRPFVLKSVEVNHTIIDIFNNKLALKKGRLLEMHSTKELSGSEVRIIKNRATTSTEKLATGSHTDFGSLTFLHNRQGGLQVLPPGSQSWQYVKPIANHAICNVGDALSIFSGGILRSNLHRVLPPPSTQANTERWSLVFFTRPGNPITLRPLVDESPAIAEAMDKQDSDSKKVLNAGVTAQEWCQRRFKNRRAANNTKDFETFRASRGTESIEVL